MGVYADNATGRVFVQFQFNHVTYKKRLPESMTLEDAASFEKEWRSKMLESRILKGLDIDLGHDVTIGNRSNKGFVYVLQSGSLFKIGHTFNMSKRLASIRAGNPQGVTPIFVIKVSNPFLVERRFHAAFASKKWAGEWFKLTDEDLEFFACIAGLKVAVKQISLPTCLPGRTKAKLQVVEKKGNKASR